MEIDLALDTSLVIDNPIDAAIQELDLLLSTDQTQLIGHPEFGVNMEQFLWQMTPSPNEVKSYLNKKILENTFWCNRLNIDISVDVVKGTIRNIYVIYIDIKMPDGSRSSNKTYEFR